MTNDQIELVQNSFTQVAPIAETAAGMFYGLQPAGFLGA